MFDQIYYFLDSKNIILFIRRYTQSSLEMIIQTLPQLMGSIREAVNQHSSLIEK